MAETIDIAIRSIFSPAGTQQATTAYRNLQTAQDTLAKAHLSAAAAGQKSNTETEKAAAAVTRAEKAVLAEASAIARLQVAQGNATGGTQALSTAISRVDQSSTAAIRAQTQLTTIENRLAADAQRAAAAQEKLAAANNRAGSSGSGLIALPRTIDGITGPAARAVIAITGIGSAMAAISKTIELAQIGAQSKAVEASFQRLAASSGTTSQALLSNMRAAASGTISDTSLMASANTGLMLAGDKMAKALPQLIETARVSARATGQDVTFIFDSLVRGIARGSPQIIDNAGITLDAAGAMETYAQSVGKTVEQLSDQDRQQATLNAVLAAGAGFVQTLGTATDDDATKMQRATVAVDELKTALGQRLAPVVGTVAEGLTNFLSKGDFFVGAKGGADQAQATITAQAQTYEEYVQRIGAANTQLREEIGKTDPVFAALVGGLDALTPAQFAYAQSLIDAGVAQGEAVAKAQEFQGEAENLQRSLFAVGAGADLATETQAQLGGMMLTVASYGEEGKVAVDDLSFAFQNGEITADQLTARLMALIAAHDQAAQASSYDEVETQRLTQAQSEQGSVIDQTAAKTLLAADAKETDAAKTQLLESQTRTAVEAFLQLNPNVSASGVAAMAAAGQINPLLAQLVQATIRANEARGALAAFNALAGVKAAPISRQADRAELADIKHSAVVQQRQSEIAEIRRAEEAERKYQAVLGNQAPTIAHLRAEAAQLAKDRGKGSAEYINKLTEITQAEQRAAKASGGGGGGKARTSEAEKTQGKLTSIEEKTGDKLTAIDEQTQQKLLALDQKYAEQRAEAQRKLAAVIMTSSDDLIADQETNDLELIGASEENAAKLAAREAAEAQARIRNEQAVAEARQMAAAGDAETAQQILSIRQDAIAKQQSLDQTYAEKQAELAGNPEALAALQVQYDEATAAIAKAESDRVGLTTEAAAQRAQAQQAERDAVLATATDQKDKVISTAIEQADGVKGASTAQKQAVLAALNEQISGAQGWASATEAATARVVSAAGDAGRAIASIPSLPSGGASAPPAAPAIGGRAAGGGTFETSGPALLLVGDNPGGRERVNVSPISGRGKSGVASGGKMIALAGGGTVDAGGGESGTLAQASGILRIAQSAAADARVNTDALKSYADALTAGVTILQSVITLTTSLQGRALPALDISYVQQIADEAKAVSAVLKNIIVPTSEDAAKSASAYLDLVGSEIDTLTATAELTTALQGRRPPTIDPAYILTIAQNAQRIGQIMGSVLVPVSQADGEMAKGYRDAVSNTVGILNDTLDLGTKLRTATPPIDSTYVLRLAQEARRVGAILGSTLVPISQVDSEMVKDYKDAVEATVGILVTTAELNDKLRAAPPEVNEAYVRKLAQQTRRIGQVIGSELVPISQADSEMAQDYKQAVEAATGTIKAALEINAGMFAEFAPPTDADVRRVVTSAKRIAVQVGEAARAIGTDGMASAKAFNEATGGMFGTLKDGLLFFQAIGSGDFVLDPANLDLFEQATMKTLDTVERLGTRAAAIPAGAFAALQSSAAALSAQSQALIQLNAVPFGNISAAAGNYQPIQSGAGASSTVNYIININNPPPQINVPALVQQIKSGIQQSVTSRK